MKELKSIDMHTHYLPNALVEALERNTDVPRIIDQNGSKFVEFGPGSLYPLLPEMTDIGLKLAHMDAGDISLSILSVQIPGVDWLPRSNAASVARDANDELIELVTRHPNRLAAIATLPLQHPDAAVDEIHRSVGHGLRGAMIYSNVWGEHVDAPSLRPVFGAAADLDVPILIHPTYPLGAATLDVHALIPMVGFLFDTTTAALRLIFDGLFERHPDFKLILAHVGSLIPYIVGRLDQVANLYPSIIGGSGALSAPPSEVIQRHLYVDTVSAWAPALRLALDYLGPNRIMLGTDHPFWEPLVAWETLKDLDLAPETAQTIVRSNAERVFGLEVHVEGD